MTAPPPTSSNTIMASGAELLNRRSARATKSCRNMSTKISSPLLVFDLSQQQCTQQTSELRFLEHGLEQCTSIFLCSVTTYQVVELSISPSIPVEKDNEQQGLAASLDPGDAQKEHRMVTTGYREKLAIKAINAAAGKIV